MGPELQLLAENQARVELGDELLQPETKTFRRCGGDPFQGMQHPIRFEGVDFQRLDLASWQEHPDVVTQQVLLLNDTIAAKAACSDGFIPALPAGTPS